MAIEVLVVDDQCMCAISLIHTLSISVGGGGGGGGGEESLFYLLDLLTTYFRILASLHSVTYRTSETDVEQRKFVV